MRTFAALSLLVCLPWNLVHAQGQNAGVQVYKNTVPSVVWIQSATKRGLATGSGALIDTKQRLVLTNYHVVEDNPNATLFFAEFKDGQPIAERRYYQDRAARFGISGKVIAKDPTTDLALIQLEKLPDNRPAITLAARSPDVGETIHSLGNAGSSGALWGYVRGTVRSVYRKKWQARLGSGRLATFEARIIEADSPTNPGDSGGPLLNDQGELIGVTQGGAINANAVSYFIDLSEVRQLLRQNKIQLAVVDQSNDSLPSQPKLSKSEAPARSKHLPPKDEAKLFLPKRLQQLESDLAYLYEHGAEFVVETYSQAPTKIRAKMLKADAEERAKLLNDWAKDRLDEVGSDGVILVITKEPRAFQLYAKGSLAHRVNNPQKTMTEMIESIQRGLKANVSDDGLADAVRTLRQNLKTETTDKKEKHEKNEK